MVKVSRLTRAAYLCRKPVRARDGDELLEQLVERLHAGEVPAVDERGPPHEGWREKCRGRGRGGRRGHSGGRG